MDKLHDLSDSKCGMIVGTRCGSSNISETAALKGFSCARVFKVDNCQSKFVGENRWSVSEIREN